MTLSKLEIQQMLREMNVKFDANESCEVLKQRLQRENHAAWLKSGGADAGIPGGNSRRVIKKRKRSPTLPSPPESSGLPPLISDETPDSPAEPHHTAGPAPVASPEKPRPHFHPRPIEKPVPGKPWKTVSEGTEPFNRNKNVFESVLRRADRCCECCGRSEDPTSPAEALSPCYLLPPDQGGEHSIKNMVALCTDCGAALATGALPKNTIKELHRKTRAKLYSPPEVVKKSGAQKRRVFSGH